MVPYRLKDFGRHCKALHTLLKLIKLSYIAYIQLANRTAQCEQARLTVKELEHGHKLCFKLPPQITCSPMMCDDALSDFCCRLVIPHTLHPVWVDYLFSACGYLVLLFLLVHIPSHHAQ